MILEKSRVSWFRVGSGDGGSRDQVLGTQEEKKKKEPLLVRFTTSRQPLPTTNTNLPSSLSLLPFFSSFPSSSHPPSSSLPDSPCG